jgi:hypothetical protein
MKFMDIRPMGQLAMDDGTQASPTQIETNANINAALQAASGMLEAACMAGKRYMPEDLNAIIAQNGNSAYHIKLIICWLATEIIRDRRIVRREQGMFGFEWALSELDQLRTGNKIFATQESAAAGLADYQFWTQGDIDSWNLITRNQNFWGVRGSYGAGIPGSSASRG